MDDLHDSQSVKTSYDISTEKLGAAFDYTPTGDVKHAAPRCQEEGVATFAGAVLLILRCSRHLAGPSGMVATRESLECASQLTTMREKVTGSLLLAFTYE